MRVLHAGAIAVFALCALASGVVAQPMIYPKAGQSQQQVDKDKFECGNWAKQQTGFDPAYAQAAPPPAEPTTGAVRGAARGAAMGAAIGAIAGDAGKGAAIGAAGGGMGGAMRKRDQERAAEQQVQQQEAAIQQQRANYDRAMKVCLEGRNYAVE